MSRFSSSKITIASGLLLMCALAVPAFAADTLVGEGAAGWRFKDDGSDQGTAWKASAFDDSTWGTGTCSFGYGDPCTTQVAASKITYYFRKSFNVVNPAAYTALTLRLNYDDGLAVYINGTEVKRLGIAAGATYTTTATNHESGTWETFSIPPGTLVAGNNVVAVEVHNQAASSTDLHMNMGLVGETSPTLTRVPYLQMAGPNRVTLRWRTGTAVVGRVQYGAAVGSLTQTATEATATTEHEVTLTGLSSATQYYYAIGDATNGNLAGNDASYFFKTAPVHGTDVPTRVWVLGDAGTNNSNQIAVRNAYVTRTAGAYTNLMLMLGDNAYTNGTDALYQGAFYDMYKDTLRQSPVWSCIGNHENDYDSGGVGYYNMFTWPTQAKTLGLSTGVDSGTEHYYSFDYGQIHFVCLDSASSQDYTTAGAMYQWASQDLTQNTGRFVVVFFHHPPYSKGSHDSDTDGRMTIMRTTFAPLFEQKGVDLVLNGHSHAYERSKFIDGHYGLSSTFNNALASAGGNVVQTGSGAPGTPYLKDDGHLAHKGAVYNVAGSAGQVSGGTLNHAAMYTSQNVLGSVILTVSGDTLHADFLDSTNVIRDTYEIKKVAATTNTAPVANADNYSLTASTTLTVATPGVLANDTDAESNPLTAVLVTQAAHGTVTLNGNGSFSYVPVAGYTGADSFTYKANDGLLDSTAATVNLTVTAIPNLALWYKFDETSGTTAADASGNGRTGALVNGPLWTAGQLAGAVSLDGVDDQVTGPTLNLTTNTMTMTGWVKRSGTQIDWAGLVFCRGGTTVSGLDIKATGELRYHWNNAANTYGFASGLIVPDGVWTFVALAVEPTKATLVMKPAGGTLASKVNAVAHAVDEFNAAILVGRDTSGTRRFKGAIDDVQVYSRTLTLAELTTLAQ